MAFEEFTVLPSSSDRKETFNVNLAKGTVQALVSSFSFLDKDTGMFVAVMPSLQLSGYGKTRKEADAMLKDAVKDFNEFILHQSYGRVAVELIRLGWQRSKLRMKHFSKAYVDINGELKNFNADENTVEKKVLQIA
jgi:hypothetical protein